MKRFQKMFKVLICITRKFSQKQKLSVNSSDKEEQWKLTLFRSIKTKIETRAKKKEMDAEYRFVAYIAAEIRELHHRERMKI